MIDLPHVTTRDHAVVNRSEMRSIVYTARLSIQVGPDGCKHTGNYTMLHYGKLFSLLMSKGLPNVVVRFILDGYIRQSACIQWEGVKSRSFNTFNGVKQGGVISPILFSIYYDELITRLSSSRYGCLSSGKFVGALSHADDITLICPSLHGLQEMVKMYHVTFNDKKKQITSCLVPALQGVNA